MTLETLKLKAEVVLPPENKLAAVIVLPETAQAIVLPEFEQEE